PVRVVGDDRMAIGDRAQERRGAGVVIAPARRDRRSPREAGGVGPHPRRRGGAAPPLPPPAASPPPPRRGRADPARAPSPVPAPRRAGGGGARARLPAGFGGRSPRGWLARAPRGQAPRSGARSEPQASGVEKVVSASRNADEGRILDVVHRGGRPLRRRRAA